MPHEHALAHAFSRCPRFQAHPSRNHLSGSRGVRYARDSRLGHTGMLVEDLLDVPGGNVEPSVRRDDVLHAVNHVQLSLLVEIPDISRAHVLADDRLGRSLGVPPVAHHHHCRVLHTDLPHPLGLGGRWRIAAFAIRVLNENLSYRHGLASTRHAAQSLIIRARVVGRWDMSRGLEGADAQDFSHAVPLLELGIRKLPHRLLHERGR
mmetsp:Transcript_30389/g.56792  ORF Transcript_30389/g.56792 Transcript_30389/m.56792 type:complete len:207 (+) Transcript_30389:493-1113(+)